MAVERLARHRALAAVYWGAVIGNVALCGLNFWGALDGDGSLVAVSTIGAVISALGAWAVVASRAHLYPGRARVEAETEAARRMFDTAEQTREQMRELFSRGGVRVEIEDDDDDEPRH